jgi:predicted porin
MGVSMIRVQVSKATAALLLAASALAMNAAAAQAADLGGNCCADLEERIAELEATTARKGNRKVSLEISGQVNEALLWWDDGTDSDSGIYTNDNSRTRFRFKGDAKINTDLKAGYLLEIGVRGANSKRFDQDDHGGCETLARPETRTQSSCGLDVRHSVWYLDSKKLGRISTGLTGGAGESVTEQNLAATKDILKYSDIEDTGLGLFARSGGTRLANRSGTSGRTGLEWRQLIRGGGDQPGEGRRSNMVKYDTPEFFGFTGIVNWGEDDLWEIGARYKNDKFHGFKVLGAIAYGENTEGPINAFNADPAPGFQCVGNNLDGTTQFPGSDTRCNQLGASLSIMHEETGIYGNIAGGYLEDEAMRTDPGFSGDNPDDRSEFYAFEIGIEKKWWDLGKTTLFGQYYRNEGGSQDRTVTTVADGCAWQDATAAGGSSGNVCNDVESGDIQSSTLESFGFGAIQAFDKAGMHVYVVYRHYEGDFKTTGTATTDPTKVEFDDLDVVMSGAIIKF